MATSLEQQPAQRYVDFDEFIDYQLQKTRATIKSVDILTALAGVATLFLGYVLVFVLLDHWIIPGGFGRGARIASLGLLLAGTAVWLVWRVGLPWLRQVDRLFAARALEKADAGFRGNLLNLVDLRRAGREVSPDVMRAIEKRTALALTHTDAEQAVDRRTLFRLSVALCLVVLVFCLYAVLSPKKVSASVWRGLFPTADVAPPTRTEIREVQPGDVRVLVGSRVEVAVTLGGVIPDDVTLLYTTGDRKYRDEPVALHEAPTDAAGTDGVRVFQGVIAGESGRGVTQSMTYRVVAGDAQSRDYTIDVVQPPSAKVDEVRYVYPAYMELAPVRQPGGAVNAWEGTAVTVRATANMPLTRAMLVLLKDADTPAPMYEIPVTITGGTQLEATWTLSIPEDGVTPRFYRIDVRNTDGQTDPQPALHPLAIRPDQRPEVEIIDPADDVLERPANAIIPLAIAARDPDFKLTSVALRIERDGKELTAGEDLMGPPPRSEFPQIHEWQLEPLGLKPGDVITWWVEAHDNKAPRANRGVSKQREVRIIEAVSQEQAQQQLARDRQEQQERLDDSEHELNDGSRENVARDDAQGQGEEPSGQPSPQEDVQNDGNSGQPRQGEEAGSQSTEQPGAEGGSQGSRDRGAGRRDQPLNPDGADDAEALKDLLRRHQQKEQDQPGEQDQPREQGSGGDRFGDPATQPQDNGQSSPSPSEQQQDSGDEQRGAGDPRGGEPGREQRDGSSQTGESSPREPGSPNPDPTGEQPRDATDAARREGANPSPQDGSTERPQEDGAGSNPMQQPRGDDPQGADEGGTGNDAAPNSQRPENPTGSGRNRRQQEGNDPARESGTERAQDSNSGDMGDPSPSPENTLTDGDHAPSGAEESGEGDPTGSERPMQAPDGDAVNDAPQDEAPNGAKPAGSGSGEAGRQQGNDDTSSETGTSGRRTGNRTQPGDMPPDSGSTGEDPEGQEEPARGGGDAERRNTTGDEQGIGQPDHDPDAQPTKEAPGVERDPMAEPARRTRPGDPPSGSDPTMREDEGNSEAPRAADQAQRPNGGADAERPMGQERRPGTASDRQGEEDHSGERRPGEPGEGRPTEAEPVPAGEDVGEAAQSREQQREGTPTDGPPDGNRTERSQDATGSEGGEPEAGEGAQEQDASERTRQGDVQRQPGAGEPSGDSDQTGDVPSDGPGIPDPSGRESRGGSVPNGGQGRQPSPQQRQDGAASPAQSEELNLKYGREATDLVLKQLEDQIERGEIDEEWLKETGWTEEQARKFAERMRQRLGQGQPATPEETARQRQFEELLKSVGRMRTNSRTRSGAELRRDDASGQIGSRRIEVPPQYREQAEAYQRARAGRQSQP